MDFATFQNRLIVTSVLLAIAGGAPAEADIIHVPVDQPTIQAGIDAAVNGDEVIVAPGTYPEIIDFDGKAITLRSSSGAAVTIIDATSVAALPDGKPVVRCDNGETSTTILDGFTITGGTGDTAVYGATTSAGGGMFNSHTNPTVRNCAFVNNHCQVGGGMLNNVASPLVSDCRFADNTAAQGGGGLCLFNAVNQQSYTDCTFHNNQAASGAGAQVEFSPVTFTGCTFSANTIIGPGSGGGLMSLTAGINLVGCRFLGNIAGFGGGMRVSDAAPGDGIINSIFVGNSAMRGAGIHMGPQPGFEFVNSTLTANTASSDGGGIWTEGFSATFSNLIIWGNTDEGGMDETAQLHSSTITPTINNSIVQGGWTGSGSNNINADPMFVNVDGVDNILGNDDDDVRVSSASPGIDAADFSAYTSVDGPATDIAGSSRFFDDVLPDTGAGVVTYLDIGAHEYDADSPVYITGACCVNGACVIISEANCDTLGGIYEGDNTSCDGVECDPLCVGDTNGDGFIDLDDLLTVIANWGNNCNIEERSITTDSGRSVRRGSGR